MLAGGAEKPYHREGPLSVQLARLVQAFLAAPGGSMEEKAAAIAVRRTSSCERARDDSRTTRQRLLASFAGVGARRAKDARAAVSALIARGNGDYFSSAPGRAAPGPPHPGSPAVVP